MTTAQKSAAKKAVNPAVVKDTLTKVKAGQEPQAIPPRDEKKDDKRLLQVSDGACIAAMQKALSFGKASLNMEVAIALVIFATDETGVHKQSKDKVMNVYKEAGFNADPTGEDYKTCHRRMSNTAKLFAKWGAPFVREHMDGKKEGAAIEALKNFLTTEFNWSGMNDVIAEATGTKPKQTNTAAYRKGRAAAVSKADAQAVAAIAANTPDGQHLNKDGSLDKRSAPEGEIAEGQKTRAEHGLQGTSKAAEGIGMVEPTKADPSPADKAVLAQMEVHAQERNQAAVDGPKSGRRAMDRGIVLVAGNLQLAIPYGTAGKDIQEMFTKLAVIAASVRDDTVVDDKFDRYSDPIRTGQPTHVAH